MPILIIYFNWQIPKTYGGHIIPKEKDFFVDWNKRKKCASDMINICSVLAIIFYVLAFILRHIL